MTSAAQQQTLAQQQSLDAGETPPPWWRPVVERPHAFPRQCVPCDVRWVDGDSCWVCGEKGSRA